MDTIKILKGDIDSDIANNRVIRERIKVTIPISVIFSIVTYILSMGISIITKTLQLWLAVSFLFWGLYSIYALIRLFKKEKVNKPSNIQSNHEAYSLFRPFMEATALFFCLDFIILLFINIKFRAILIVMSLGYTLLGFFYNKFEPYVIKGIDIRTNITSKRPIKHSSEKDIGKIYRIILNFIWSIIILGGTVGIPILVIYSSIDTIIMYNLPWTVVFILLPLQAISLFLFVKYFGSRTALYKLDEQMVGFIQIKEQLSSKKLTNIQIKNIKEAYIKEKSLKIKLVQILNIVIWIAI